MTTLSPLFTIGLALHNELDSTRACVESIMRHGGRFRCILIDNGSTDGTQDYSRGLCAVDPERFSFLDMGANRGFIKAHNRALEYVTTPYYVVLNNDIVVCDGWLDRMRQCFLDDPRTAIVGIKRTCSVLNEQGVGTSGKALDYIEGSCMMVPTQLMMRHGLFSRDMEFGYAEDADLSLRMREMGHHVHVVDLPIQHKRATTARSVAARGSVDLDGYHAFNHAVLRDRWSDYLQRRSFMRTFIVRRKRARGDVLLTVPILRALRRRNADARIVVVTDCPDCLRDNQDVSLVCPRLGQHDAENGVLYDLDLAYERDPKKHIIQAYAEKCAIKVEDWRLKVYPNAAERIKARQWLGFAGPTIAVHAGPLAWASRNWLEERWVRLCETLLDRGWNVIVVGEGEAYGLPCSLDLRGQTTFHELAAVIEAADAFVGLDSLPMHLAQAAIRPTVGLFGAIRPEYRLLPWPHCVGVTATNCGCLGCHHAFGAPRTSSVCLRESLVCMERLEVSQVLDALDRAMEAYAVQQETSKIRPFIAHLLTGKVLDIGCFRDKIAPDAVGFDDDDWPEVNVRGDAAGPLPFADGEFDVVYSSHALEDMADTEGALQHWLRVLKPGGRLVVYVPHPTMYKGVNQDHKYPGFTPDDLRPMLESLGCVIEDEFVHSGPNRYSTLMVARKR